MTSVRHSLKIALVAGLLGIACLAGRSASAQSTTPIHKKFSTGSSTVAWWITQLGLGSAGEYEINNFNNSSNALFVYTNGSGNAGAFDANTSNGVYAVSGGPSSLNSGHPSGVYGTSVDGSGVAGFSNSFIGVLGQSLNSMGVYGYSTNNFGVYGRSDNNYAGYFQGDLYVTGTVHYGSLSKNSDARYKRNVRTLSDALGTVLALRGVSYDWRQREFPQMHFSNTHQIGFIAQEVEKVLPELVSKDSQGMRSLDYTGVIPILVEAIKQQQQQIQASKAQIETLKAQNKQLMSMQTQLAALTAKLARMQKDQQARTVKGPAIVSK
ncbi:MAG TPA: tail fiber domain-containing protein [Chthonomonadaceae bacterium]|nr:tail fiber domain-containing protein [Chthonomonadaceae bacterium]